MKTKFRKKVLFVTNNLYGGGAEKILETLLNYLNKNKYDITLYTLHKTKIKENTYKDINIKYFFLNKSVIAKFYNKLFLMLYEKFPSMFYKILIRKKYDIEIAFIEGYATKIVGSSPNKNSKKYAWVHVDLIHTPWTDVAYNNYDEEVKCYNQFDKILCVSKDVKTTFCKKYKVTTNVQVQYNPIDEKNIIRKSNQIINWKNQKCMQFVTVGRLEHQKGYDRLLRVVSRLKKEGYKFNIKILGTGSLENNLKTYVDNNDLNDCIEFLGYKENPYPYIKHAHAFLCSSYSEGFSTVVIESIILGTPVLTTDCSGMREIFGENKCGVICNNTENEIYIMVKSILEHPDNLERFKKEIEIRKTFFTLNTRMQEVEELLYASED